MDPYLPRFLHTSIINAALAEDLLDRGKKAYVVSSKKVVYLVTKNTHGIYNVGFGHTPFCNLPASWEYCGLKESFTLSEAVEYLQRYPDQTFVMKDWEGINYHLKVLDGCLLCTTSWGFVCIPPLKSTWTLPQ